MLPRCLSLRRNLSPTPHANMFLCTGLFEYLIRTPRSLFHYLIMFLFLFVSFSRSSYFSFSSSLSFSSVVSNDSYSLALRMQLFPTLRKIERASTVFRKAKALIGFLSFFLSFSFSPFLLLFVRYEDQ